MWSTIVNDGLTLYDWDTLEKIKHSDIITFTISFEEQFLNIIRMLKFAGINPNASKRGENDPIIIAGGPCSSYNPEPLADIIDAFIVGEGEEVIHPILEKYEKSNNKSEFLRLLDELDCTYIPSLYDFEFEDATIKSIVSRGKKQVLRKYTSDINQSPIYSSIINANCTYGKEVFSIEVSRGCRMPCRFCYMGNHFRKQRMLSIDRLKTIIKDAKIHTPEMKLFYESLPSEYSENLFQTLLEFINEDEIQLNLGSFRAESLNPDILKVVSRGQQEMIILAPETSQGKLRTLLGKGQMTNDRIKSVFTMCGQQGIKNFGLYLMMGIPTESLVDIDQLIELILEVFEIVKQTSDKGILELHINSFFPKPLTPLQWEENISQDRAIKRFEYIKNKIRESLSDDEFKRVAFKTIVYEDITYSQPILARGDRRLGGVLIDVCESVYPYTQMELSKSLWDSSLNKHNLKAEYFYRARCLDEILPWHLIKNNLKQNYYSSERAKAYCNQQSAPCPAVPCHICQSCVEVKRRENNTCMSPIESSN